VQSLDEGRTKILAELRGEEDDSVRKEFWQRFEKELTEFVEVMSESYLALRPIDAAVKGDEGRGIVAALVYSTLMLHVLSMKLLLSGHIVAAGALSRQVLEAIALSLLCSKKDLGVRARFANDQYSANDAVAHVIRKCKELNLKPDGVKLLRDAQTFYHQYSHVSKFTIAAALSFSEEGLYVGTSFDIGKLDSYSKEVLGRLSLARVLPNFVAAVEQNLESAKQ
jgi:hypothetical protein